jgi:penicillin-binding protein 1A
MPAIVVEKPAGRKGEAWRVGLTDGRILPLSIDNAVAQRKLNLYDVILVRVVDGKGKGARAELRVRPLVQGTVVVQENKTGRILAMTGGFSYPLSQLNRAIQAVRQPGSAIKPLSYLAALGKGLQPNTLVMDEPITLPPIGGRRAREQDYWTPKNYDGSSGGTLTLRQAIENSRNLATVRLLDGGIEKKPEASLNRLCELATEAQIYRECLGYYPFVLGAQPVRPVDLAAFYAAIANEGLRGIDRTQRRSGFSSRAIIRHDKFRRSRRLLSAQDHAPRRPGARHRAVDCEPFAVCRGARPAPPMRRMTPGSSVSPTTLRSRSGSATTTRSGSTGGGVAVPIFEPVIQAVWANVVPKAALAPPSSEAKRHLTCKSVELASDEAQNRRGRASSECFRIDAKGKVRDTQYVLVSRESASSDREENKGDRERTSRKTSERTNTFYDGNPSRGQWDARSTAMDTPMVIQHLEMYPEPCMYEWG